MNTSLILILVISQYLVMGMHPSDEELASLGQESSNGYRDGIMDSPSPPRMIELLPVDEVSIVMPPYHDVSSYNKMIGEYNPKHNIPPPENRAISPYPTERRNARDMAITRTRDGDDMCTTGCGQMWHFLGRRGYRSSSPAHEGILPLC
ncbi:hypothetical protein H4Q26_006364 [Puccinia striiformis f. sp. tritici PST-130]|nr:hypothetical protein H4Q26_006364 [Puccinia striiformis f. sp. tritici PST-130]